MLRVHLFGAFYLTRAAWPHLALDGTAATMIVPIVIKVKVVAKIIIKKR